MGNKVINLGNQTKASQENLEVYRDVSMISDKVNGKFKISKDVNVKAVFNSLHNIFTWIPGENILIPDFGSRLRKMLYEQITEYNVESHNIRITPNVVIRPSTYKLNITDEYRRLLYLSKEDFKKLSEIVPN